MSESTPLPHPALPPWDDLAGMSPRCNELMRRSWELINLSQTLHHDPDALAECWAEAVRVEDEFQQQDAIDYMNRMEAAHADYKATQERAA